MKWKIHNDMIYVGDLVKVNDGESVGWVVSVVYSDAKQFRVQWHDGSKYWYGFETLIDNKYRPARLTIIS